MNKYVFWLKEIHQHDIAKVGGKAANLGDMARGLTVPEGFCLTAEAYHQNLERHGIYKVLSDKLADLNYGDIRSVDKLSAEISAIITETPLLPEIESAVVTAFKKLGEGKVDLKVAVRSSATAEDLPDASFAGQQETFLSVSGIENVLLDIKRCWASLWTSRAIHYRTQKGFSHDKVRMAVIIQEMVPAAISGVMFTANPVNNSRDEIRIEAVRGLGEKLVSGQAAGDVYILKKDDVNVQIISKSISDAAEGQMFSDYVIRELAHIGLKIELYYETFQDIEWAYSHGKFYFLQTRPITTLADEELPDINVKKMSKFQRDVMNWVAERFPEPVMPIDGIIVKLLFLAQFEAMKSYGYKIDDMDWSRVDKGIFPEFFVPPVIKPGLKRILPYLNLSKTLRSDPAAGWAAEQKYLLDTLAKLKGRDISGLPIELVSEYLTEGLHHFHFFFVMRYKYFADNRIPSYLLYKFLRFLFKEEGTKLYENLLAGSDNTTLDINRCLRELATEACKIPEVRLLFSDDSPGRILSELNSVNGGKEYLGKLEEFLNKYGERETSMGLGGIASPTWSDKPEVVIGIIKSILSEDNRDEGLREKDRVRRMKEAEEVVEARLSRGIYAVLPFKSLFKKVVSHSRSFAAFRENSHYDVTRCLHVFRILFTDLGERFVRRGILENKGDIFFLSYFEIREIMLTIFFGLEEVNVYAVKAKIDSRKAEQGRRIQRWAQRGKQFDATGAISGIPASQGLVSGPARIIKDPMEFHRLKKGEILIAPYTNPAWTPLFITAVGLVVETGGAASHAAIIAREYGIPAVMGVAGATELIKEGEIITVNGSTGVVYRGQQV